MKHHLLTLLLVLSILIACTAAAGAETIVTDVDASSVDVISSNDRIVITVKAGTYLADAKGKKLSAYYDYISRSYDAPNLMEVRANTNSVHREGIIDTDGNIVVPAKYGDVSILSSRWQIGVTLTPSTEKEVGDYSFTNYSTGKKTYYYVDKVDIYYKGTLVGTVDRTDYDYAYCYGDYICLKNRAGKYTYYNKDFQPSPYKTDYSSEYDTQYKSGKTTYIHAGSGQTAFAPGCTLTPDEVYVCYQLEKGQILDLQGNVVASLKQNYDSVSTFRGKYTQVRLYGKYGLIDDQGNEAIAPEYDGMSYSYSDTAYLGFAGVIKDGLFGYVDFNGNVVADFVYGQNAVRDQGTFAYIKDLSGKTIVLSGLVGELPERYADVSISSGALAFVAERSDGQKAVIGLNGQELVPFGEYRYMYVNKAGTVAIAYLESRQYRVWQIDEGTATYMEKPAAAEEKPEDDGTWTCSNGHSGNTGKFCGECGVRRSVVCSQCGTEYTENVPKFCPECGNPLQ